MDQRLKIHDMLSPVSHIMFSFFSHAYAFLRNAYHDVVPFVFAFPIGIGPIVSAVYGGLLLPMESGFSGHCVGVFFLGNLSF